MVLAVASATVGAAHATEPTGTLPDSSLISPELLPPRILSITDTPNDAGTSLDMKWEVSPSEAESPGALVEYHILRAEAAEGEFEQVASVQAGTDSYTDDGTDPNRPYWYRIDSVGDSAVVASAVWGPVASRMQWFNRGRTVVAVLVLFTCASVLISIWLAKRKAGGISIRRIPVINAIDEAIGRATEMGKPVLYITGGLDVDDPQTVASMTILSHVGERTANYGARLMVPCYWPMAMSMARETVKESHTRVGRPDTYREDDIFYVTTDQFGFVAGVDGIMMRERPAANFYLGAFYAESLVLAETGHATGAMQIAGTASIDQLPFFVAACDYTLLGEEMYATGASLSGDAVQLGTIRGQDFAKAIFLVVILGGVVLKLLGVDAVSDWLTIH